MLKQYISADELLRDSCELAMRIVQSGFRPTLIAGVWRGGTPVAIAVQEVMEFLGLDCDHIAIRTSSYSGMEQRAEVQVHGLEYLHRTLKPTDSLLLVDDVYDTGLSMEQVLKELQALFGNAAPTIKLAMPYFKPAHNLTSRTPDFYLHTTSEWLVFPHELQGLTDTEIMGKHGLQDLTPRLLQLRDKLAKS
jgi:hypoxanthine phosphoribosyltransferase